MSSNEVQAIGHAQSIKRTEGKTSLFMMAIVIAYFAQWWPFSIYQAWYIVEQPPIILVQCIVIFCNLGGVFNFFAYTFIRRRYGRSRRISNSSSDGGSRRRSLQSLPSVKRRTHKEKLYNSSSSEVTSVELVVCVRVEEVYM